MFHLLSKGQSCFLLVLLVAQAYASQPPNANGFLARRISLLPRDDIDFGAMPNCSRPYCNATAALSPSRLGCIEPTLTKACLCEKAVAPLACVPTGPSSEDNCWYDTEDWFAGQCDKKVPIVPETSMPSCLQDCATNWLRTKGCRTDTRNCFCKMDAKELVAAVQACKKGGCMKRMQPAFDVAFWREQVCSQGGIDMYDDRAYQKRKKMVRNVQITVPIFVLLIALPLMVASCVISEPVPFFVGAALILLIIPPIFVAI